MRIVMLPAGKRHSGFTYPVVLVAIVVLTVAADTASELVSAQVRRDMEEELLFRGMAYREAIRSYYAAVPGQPAYPRSIEDLLSDPRFPLRRHLRQAYADPAGGPWRLILAEGGRIMGVASRSDRPPLRRAHLPNALSQYSEAKRLSEWEFVFLPGGNT